jgi:benzoylformate decarboxylase
MDIREPVIDYAALAGSMGVAARRIADPGEVAPALREALASGRPRLLEVMVQDGFGT